MFNTIKNKYLDSKIRGWFFSIILVIYRKVVDVGLQNDYVSSGVDSLTKTVVHRLSVLPLVSTEQLDRLFIANN